MAVAFSPPGTPSGGGAGGGEDNGSRLRYGRGFHAMLAFGNREGSNSSQSTNVKRNRNCLEERRIIFGSGRETQASKECLTRTCAAGESHMKGCLLLVKNTEKQVVDVHIKGLASLKQEKRKNAWG